MYSLLSRQKEIIIYLINQNDYSPVKHIADIIKVSEKTVYRELKFIEEYLKEKYIRMEKRPGIGIKLLITKEQKMKSQKMWRSSFFTWNFSFTIVPAD